MSVSKVSLYLIKEFPLLLFTSLEGYLYGEHCKAMIIRLFGEQCNSATTSNPFRVSARTRTYAEKIALYFLRAR